MVPSSSYATASSGTNAAGAHANRDLKVAPTAAGHATVPAYPEAWADVLLPDDQGQVADLCCVGGGFDLNDTIIITTAHDRDSNTAHGQQHQERAGDRQ